MTSDDKESFAALFTSVSDELYRIAYIYLKNRDDSLDAVSEAACRCFKSRRSLKSPEHFRTWAVRVVINCSLDILRQRKRTVPLDEAVTPAVSGETDGSRALLEALLNTLSEREKSVIVLHELTGLSFREVARALKLPESTVKSIHYRAMNKLKREASSDEK